MSLGTYWIGTTNQTDYYVVLPLHNTENRWRHIATDLGWWRIASPKSEDILIRLYIYCLRGAALMLFGQWICRVTSIAWRIGWLTQIAALTRRQYVDHREHGKTTLLSYLDGGILLYIIVNKNVDPWWWVGLIHLNIILLPIRDVFVCRAPTRVQPAPSSLDQSPGNSMKFGNLVFVNFLAKHD